MFFIHSGTVFKFKMPKNSSVNLFAIVKTWNIRRATQHPVEGQIWPADLKLSITDAESEQNELSGQSDLNIVSVIL